MGARLLVLGFALLLAVSARHVSRDLETKRDLHRASYGTSASCTRCHADHAASFGRTFHRTMTQLPSRASVRAPFAGETLEYFGVRARMTEAAGAFFVSYVVDGKTRRFAVEKTIGSRRYQQYVARSEDTSLVRLPVAFDLDAGRWFHMNGAFLTPDPALPLAAADFERHVTRWNDNCVFCHNVSPNPGRTLRAGEVTFDTRVAEHGIACEACHGPGEEHARVNENPLRRYRLHLGDEADPTIVNPARLSPERAADVCGRCHGQRLTDDVDHFLRDGDPFVPGDDLSLYSAPLWRDTTLNGQEGVFAARFWPDGTPRLTAYEFQGMLMSACAAEGALTCTDCHGMHSGDPRGQLRPERTGPAMCTHCHEPLASESAQVRHARHGETPPACTSCHMPALVFGVLTAHASHRIERPDPARAARHQRPDACTACHVDETRAWAARERAHLWGPSAAPMPAESAWSEVETQLFAGDPLERALAAQALAERSAMAPSERPAKDRRHAALLLAVMADDPYPAVRRLAARSLASFPLAARAEVEAFVPETPAARRRVFVDALRNTLSLAPPDPDTLRVLRERAEGLAIEIGE